MVKRLAIIKLSWISLLLGFVIGILALLAIRFFTYNPGFIHYHANFAVYINGQHQLFQGPQYYQEVSICSKSNNITIPQQRAHMHENINNLVHIHDHAVTWGQFFENLGWYIGPDFIETDSGTMYTNNGSNVLHIIINGQDYTGLTPVTNMVIKDRSKLLVSFGNIDNNTLNSEYKAIPSTAAYNDTHKDPASCSGNETITTSERLAHLF